jgi:predicted lipoprotein with Yx(FWY)xxD motif
LEDSRVGSRSIGPFAVILAVSTILAGCSGGAPAPSEATILAAAVGADGTLLVAGSNRMTVYSFSKDIAGSATSNCTSVDACITTWPALTVPAGTAPSAGPGVTGTVSTIARADLGGALQVTYKGLPLYFYSRDSAVGDSNGIYADWNAVKP